MPSIVELSRSGDVLTAAEVASTPVTKRLSIFARYLNHYVVTDDAVRSLAISQRLLGTTEIALIHHTRCGCASQRRTILKCAAVTYFTLKRVCRVDS